MAFYTFCDRVGSRIFHRYVDDKGIRNQEIVSDFPIELFIRSPKDHARSLYGDKLGKMEFNEISKALEFIKEYDGMTDVFGQTNLVSQFISRTYEGEIEYNFNKFRILNLDIEVRTDGYDDDEDCTVRRVFSNDSETVTIGEMKGLGSSWEVWDKYNECWYNADDDEAPFYRPGGFPHAERAEYEITTIACKLFGKDKIVTFGIKECKVQKKNRMYVRCADEKALLTEFLNFVRTIDPDIFTGWNIETFDIPYIVNRIKRLHGDEVANRLSPFHAHTKKCLQPYMAGDDKEEPSYRVLGVMTLDYMQAYKKFNPKRQESYSLNYIAQEEVGAEKVDYSEYNDSLMELYLKNFDLFVEYNEQDVLLVEKIDDRKQFARLAITTVLMTKSRYQDVMGKVKLWDNLIYNMLLTESVVIPPAKTHRNEGKIEGAYVKQPTAGKYRCVVSFDFTSLYPTICMMFNMSPETLVVPEQGTIELVEKILKGIDLAEDARLAGRCMAANGSEYRLDIDGVLPRAMRLVFNKRKAYKDEMKDVKKKKEKYIKEGGDDSNILLQYDNKIAMLDAAQGAMKILANSGYGVCANTAFRYFSRDIAQGITVTGQLILRYTLARVVAWLNERFKTNRDFVITADTDSMYLALDCVPSQFKDPAAMVEELDQFIKAEMEPFIKSVMQELADKMGCPESMMDMKREAISDVGIWRAKKNYILRVWDMEGVRYAKPEIKQMGLESIKAAAFPKYARDAMSEAFTLMLEEGKEKELISLVERFRKDFYNRPLEDISKPIGVSDLKSYSDAEHIFRRGVTVPYNTKAALIHNWLIREKGLTKKVERIRNGNRIRLLDLKKINPVRNSCIAFIGKLPEEFGLHQYIDISSQFDKMYLNPVKSMADIVGWKTEQVSTLEDLFG